MNVSQPPIYKIASAYQVTRQRLFQMRKKYSLTTEDFRDPDYVFSHLLETARCHPMRSRLTDAATRESIREQLKP